MKWIRAVVTFIEDSLEALAFDDRVDVKKEHEENRRKRWLKWLYSDP